MECLGLPTPEKYFAEVIMKSLFGTTIREKMRLCTHSADNLISKSFGGDGNRMKSYKTVSLNKRPGKYSSGIPNQHQTNTRLNLSLHANSDVSPVTWISYTHLIFVPICS